MTPAEPLLTRPAEGLRRGLEGALERTPHDFVPGLDVERDRSLLIDRLLKPLPPGDDLRIALGDGDDERWALLQRLPWDSDFFGRGTARLDGVFAPGRSLGLREPIEQGQAALSAALDLAAQRDVDYVFATVDARDLPLIRTLSATGFELIETRCTFHSRLTRAGSRFASREATAADVPSLAAAARHTINSFDRFHADPAIPPADADRLMEQWVRASILDDFADLTIVPDVDEPRAFLTAKTHRDQWDSWGVKLAQHVLAAVAPEHRGWHVKLLSELSEHLLDQGAEHLYFVTQATNNAVFRSCEKLGYRYAKTEHTFRKLP